MAITQYDKNKALNNLRHWYKSHKQSLTHYEEQGNEKAVDYHKNQMYQLKWMANLINQLEVREDFELDDDDDKLPFQLSGFAVIP